MTKRGEREGLKMQPLLIEIGDVHVAFSHGALKRLEGYNKELVAGSMGKTAKILCVRFVWVHIRDGRLVADFMVLKPLTLTKPKNEVV